MATISRFTVVHFEHVSDNSISFDSGTMLECGLVTVMVELVHRLKLYE